MATCITPKPMSIPPLTLRTVFAPEINHSTAQQALRQVWPQCPLQHPPSPTVFATNDTFMHYWHKIPSDAIIQKPRGTVTEVSKGGYSLSEALGWNRAQYKEVQV